MNVMLIMLANVNERLETKSHMDICGNDSHDSIKTSDMINNPNGSRIVVMRHMIQTTVQ